MDTAFSNKTIEKLKYDLVRKELITYDDLLKAEEEAKNNNASLSQIFIQMNYISEEKLLNFIESKLHIPYVNLEDYTLDKNCLDLISEKDARNYRIIPLFKIENVLTVAMADPLDLFIINELIISINCKIEPVICSESSILKEIDRYYLHNDINVKDFHPNNAVDFDWREELTDEYPDNFQIKRIIQAIFYQAFMGGVREVFFENDLNGLNIIFKENNLYVNKGTIPTLLVPMFISKLKLTSNLDPIISEVPQLGRYKFFIDSFQIIASISSFPTIKGERITVKLYTPPQELDKILTNIEYLEIIKSKLTGNGIIVISGSELTGKTSLIYSILSSIQSTKTVLTIESVIKYDLPKIIQCELNERAGFNFEKAIKHVEFQSPDVIYFEELFTREYVDYTVSLAQSNKLIVTEFFANNYSELLNRFDNPMFAEFKKFIACLIFIENKDNIKILEKDLLH